MSTKNSLTQEQLDRLKQQSGTSSNGVRLPVLPRISLNGNCDAVEDDKGKLVRPPVSYRKMILPKDRDEKPTYEELGSPLEVTFIKIRRRLIARDKKGVQVMSTTQHSSKTDVVSLWKDGECIATDKASILRQDYDDLKTVQEIYALYKGKLVMIIVKGSAFGSQTRDKKYPTFYEYLQSLNEDGIYGNVTILGGVKEKGLLKDYYTMTFEKGRPTTDVEKISVLEHSDELTKIMEEYDLKNSISKDTSTKTKEGEYEEEIKEDFSFSKLSGKKTYNKAIEYPEDDIDPNDIPF